MTDFLSVTRHKCSETSLKYLPNSPTVAAWGKVTFLCGILREKVQHYPLRLEDAVIFARVQLMYLKPIKRAIKIK